MGYIIILTIFIIGLFLVTLREEEKQIVFNQNINVMAYNPTTIANYFVLNYAKYGVITPMKLLKLTYIAYGWYLAISDGKEKLIDELPQAWKYGPVFPSLYKAIKQHGTDKIDSAIPYYKEEQIKEEDAEILDMVWDKYGDFNAIQLMEMTHAEGTPWKKVYCEGCNSTISDIDIYNHYAEKLNTVQNA